MSESDPRTEYVPIPATLLHSNDDERVWTVHVPPAPEGHHVEIELPVREGRQPTVTVVKNATKAKNDG